MTMLKRGDAWIHFAFTDGRQTNKLQARNLRLSAKGELSVELLHYQRPRGDLSDSDYRLMITTGSSLTSAVIGDKTVIQKIQKSGVVLTVGRGGLAGRHAAHADRGPGPAERLPEALS